MESSSIDLAYIADVSVLTNQARYMCEHCLLLNYS